MGLALGESGSLERIRPAELQAETPKPPPAFLERVVEFLSCVTDLTFRQLTNSGDDGWTVPLDVLVERVPLALRLISSAADASSRQCRRVAILRVDQDSGARVWVIVEDNEDEECLICSYSVDESSDDAELERFRHRFAEGLRASAAAVGAGVGALDDHPRAPAPSETIRAVLKWLSDY